MEPALSESLKNVVRVKELIKECTYLGREDKDRKLEVALELLEKTEEILAKTQ